MKQILWFILLAFASRMANAAGPVDPATGSAPLPVTTSKARLGDAFHYQQESLSEGPWSVHVVRIRRDRPDLGIHVLLGGSNHLGVGTLSSQAAAFPKNRGLPLAAINGDFFARQGPCLGDPEGLCIRNGELISAPNGKSAFWVGPDRSLHMGSVVSLLSITAPGGTKMAIGLNEERHERPVLYTAALGTRTPSANGTECLFLPESASALPLRPGERSTLRLQSLHLGGNTPIPTNGVVLSLPEGSEPSTASVAIGSLWTLSTETQPNLRNISTALGGGPALIKGGQPTQYQSSDARHPRSAIGWNDQFLFLVQVDGRQPGISVGMTLGELGVYIAGLGCTEVLNLDGGGSSTLWARGQVMNVPCEGSERPMGNALLISVDARAGAPR